MKKITILALTATTVATILAACGGSTKNSGNGEGDDDGGTGAASSGSSGGSNSGSSSGDAQSTTYTSEGGISVTTTLNCMSASTCGSQVCCGTVGFSTTTFSATITSSCAASPCGTGATSLQLCATSSECTTSGDSCQSLANAYGGGAAGGVDLPDINVCIPEGGANNPLADGGCATYGGTTYCRTADGGYAIVTDASTTTDSSTTSDASTSDAATGGGG